MLEIILLHWYQKYALQFVSKTYRLLYIVQPVVQLDVKCKHCARELSNKQYDVLLSVSTASFESLASDIDFLHAYESKP